MGGPSARAAIAKVEHKATRRRLYIMAIWYDNLGLAWFRLSDGTYIKPGEYSQWLIIETEVR